MRMLGIPCTYALEYFKKQERGLGKSSLTIEAKAGRGRVMLGVDCRTSPVCKSDRGHSAEPTQNNKSVVGIILSPQLDPHTTWLQTEILSLMGEVWHVCCQKALTHALGICIAASKNRHHAEQ